MFLGQITAEGEVLETVRIVSDVDRLTNVIDRAGESPEVVLEATYGWYWAVDALQAAGAQVHPELQGKGVGTALVRDVLARAEESGESLVALVGDPAYYGRFDSCRGENLAWSPLTPATSRLGPWVLANIRKGASSSRHPFGRL